MNAWRAGDHLLLLRPLLTLPLHPPLPRFVSFTRDILYEAAEQLTQYTVLLQYWERREKGGGEAGWLGKDMAANNVMDNLILFCKR